VTGGPREKTIVYHAPFDRFDREADYTAVWGRFADRLGEQRPGYASSCAMVASKPAAVTHTVSSACGNRS
jgi:hypothetical protein